MTRDETNARLAAAGFRVSVDRDVTAVMGPRFAEMSADLARSMREGRVGIALGIAEAA